MKNDRNTEMANRLAENRAVHSRGAVAKVFAKKLQCSPAELEFAGAIETRRLLNTFRERWTRQRQTHGPLLKTRKREEVAAAVRKLRLRLPVRHLLLLHDRAEDAGALRVSGPDLLAKFEQVMELDGEDILLTDDGAEIGVTIEWFTDRTAHTASEIYQIYAWGFNTESPMIRSS